MDFVTVKGYSRDKSLFQAFVVSLKHPSATLRFKKKMKKIIQKVSYKCVKASYTSRCFCYVNLYV